MRPDRVMFPKELMAFMATKTKEHEGEPASQALRGVTMRHIEDLVGVFMRHYVLGYLCGNKRPMSSKELTYAQVLSLQDWVNAEKMDDEWMPSIYFGAELGYIIKQIERELKVGFAVGKTNMMQADVVKTMKAVIDESPMMQTALQFGAVITEQENESE